MQPAPQFRLRQARYGVPGATRARIDGLEQPRALRHRCRCHCFKSCTVNHSDQFRRPLAGQEEAAVIYLAVSRRSNLIAAPLSLFNPKR